MKLDVKSKPTMRRYSPGQKEQAVRMVFALREELGTSLGTVKRVADQLGVGVESLRSWVKQAEIDSGARRGVTSAEAEENKRLRQENRELKRVNEILQRAAHFLALRESVGYEFLKSAAAFFGAELDRQQK